MPLISVLRRQRQVAYIVICKKDLVSRNNIREGQERRAALDLSCTMVRFGTRVWGSS